MNMMDLSPENLYGELFTQVQLSGLYKDSKTFVDVLPRMSPHDIMERYNAESQCADFNLTEFVRVHFHDPIGEVASEPAFTSEPLVEHIDHLWEQLERSSQTDQGSLLALPHPYIVPGGRFSEQFYWDTYFVMLGLAADSNWTPIEKMMKNYTFMIKHYGFIPNANRTYFLSRSQPPFFALMVQLLASQKGEGVYAEHLPTLLAEYKFWMSSREQDKNAPSLRTVPTSHGVTLNRHYDSECVPRPESYSEDVHTASNSTDKQKTFRDLRAGAESGWDFSSRWLTDPTDLSTICTTDITPVDLNALLYTLESVIAEAYKSIGAESSHEQFTQKAQKRAEAITQLMWDEVTGFFYDYNHVEEERTPYLTLAGVYPLYAGIATQEQADRVAATIQSQFLLAGGVVTTLHQTGQQWDYPNGWAPLQWVTIEGLRRYGHDSLADKVKTAWMASVETVFTAKRKLVEKYDVANDTHTGGGGGEYPLQDGFGWSNGVYKALHANFSPRNIPS